MEAVGGVKTGKTQGVYGVAIFVALQREKLPGKVSEMRNCMQLWFQARQHCLNLLLCVAT
jgi:hypothetical protein